MRRCLIRKFSSLGICGVCLSLEAYLWVKEAEDCACIENFVYRFFFSLMCIGCEFIALAVWRVITCGKWAKFAALYPEGRMHYLFIYGNKTQIKFIFMGWQTNTHIVVYLLTFGIHRIKMRSYYVVYFFSTIYFWQISKAKFEEICNKPSVVGALQYIQLNLYCGCV